MSAIRKAVLLLLLGPGCTIQIGGGGNGGSTDTGDTGLDTGTLIDADLDGFGASVDCDDSRDDIYPGAQETCDTVDQDCDSVVDEDATDASTWYADTDSDGYGDPNSSELSCAAPAGYLADDQDCDDSRAAVNPAATELCENGLDDDCDGLWDACRFPTGAGLTDSDHRVLGTEPSALAGAALAAGDVTADGVPDLLVAAPLGDGGASNGGAVYVVPGPFTGGEQDLSTATAWVYGPVSGDGLGLGTSVASGDLNGDGFGDLVVGAPHSDVPRTNGGGAALFYGPVSGELDFTRPDVFMAGQDYAADAGWTFAVGDVDADGTMDLAVGSPEIDSQYGEATGMIYLLRGPLTQDLNLSGSDAWLVGVDPRSRTGESIAIGDVDADGIGDVVAGAPDSNDRGVDSGTTYVVFGPLPETHRIDDAADRLYGEEGSRLGTQVDAGDVNGDGYDDVLSGAPLDETGGAEAGAVYLMLGPAPQWEEVANSAHVLLGSRGTGLGAAVKVTDFDQDGNADVWVGAPSDDAVADDAGSAMVVYGPFSGRQTVDGRVALILGDSAGQQVGAGLATGDMDQDGYPDAIVGVPLQDGGGRSGVGGVHLFFGSGP